MTSVDNGFDDEKTSKALLCENGAVRTGQISYQIHFVGSFCFSKCGIRCGDFPIFSPLMDTVPVFE